MIVERRTEIVFKEYPPRAPVGNIKELYMRLFVFSTYPIPSESQSIPGMIPRSRKVE